MIPDLRSTRWVALLAFILPALVARILMTRDDVVFFSNSLNRFPRRGDLHVSAAT